MRKPVNGKPVCLGPLHYRKDTWPAVVITIFGTVTIGASKQVLLTIKRTNVLNTIRVQK